MDVVFLAFGWAEGEPAHVSSWLAETETKCPRRSQSEWAVGGSLLVELDDDSRRTRNWESN